MKKFLLKLIIFESVAIFALINTVQCADQKNVTTRLSQVQPPATSSITDRLNTIFLTSDATPTAHPHNCTQAGCLNATDSFASSSSEEEDPSVSMPDPLEDDSPFRCHSCSKHDIIVENSMKFFQKRILHKLGFNKPPNMTKAVLPRIRPQIVDQFLKKYHIKESNVNFERLTGGGVDSDDDLLATDKMQSDDPGTSNSDDYDDEYLQKEVYIEEEDDYSPITERIYVFPKSK